MSTLWNLIKQRRVWVAILSVASFALKFFGVEIDPDTQTAVIDQTMILVSLGPDVVNAILAIWSYLKPKPATTKAA